jgi:hypothetical protein
MRWGRLQRDRGARAGWRDIQERTHKRSPTILLTPTRAGITRLFATALAVVRVYRGSPAAARRRSPSRPEIRRVSPSACSNVTCELAACSHPHSSAAPGSISVRLGLFSKTPSNPLVAPVDRQRKRKKSRRCRSRRGWRFCRGLAEQRPKSARARAGPVNFGHGRSFRAPAHLVEAMRAATRMARFMLRGSARFLPAISNAVP